MVLGESHLSTHHIHKSILLARDRGLGERGRVGVLPGLEVKLGVVKSAREAKGGRNAFNTVGRVDVLNQGDLVAAGGTLARGDGGVTKEVLPDL